MSVKIESVDFKSDLYKAGVRAGDELISLNGNEIMDVLDYRFYQNDRKVEVKTRSADGKELVCTVLKGEYDELGLEFETYLMDKQRSCRNNCVFCFIDQLPKGMRDSLYFKDDDSRMSFLFGNYITLTNITEHEVERIIKMHISPVNVSVHTTNPELRCKMMNNRFAGESLNVLWRLCEAGIDLNCQLVLCPEWNDGDELKRSLSDLIKHPSIKSVACVPVGLTGHREGLIELKPFNKQTASEVVDITESFGEETEKLYGERRVFAADEFYLLSQRPMPEADIYGDFLQIENGVGMWASFKAEFEEAVEDEEPLNEKRKITVVTGEAAYPLISNCVDFLRTKWHNLECNVVAIKNNFFGGKITVAGLVTGKDIAEQLKCTDIGDELIIPSVMLRHERDMFLDSMTIEELEKALNTKVRITDNDAWSLIDAVKGIEY